MPLGRAKYVGQLMSILGLWNKRISAAIAAGVVLLLALPSSANNNWLQIPLSVDDRLRIAESGIDKLHIIDANGVELSFAFCATPESTQAVEQSVPTIALPRGIEAEVGPDGAPVFRRSPGVEREPPWERWVLDLRAQTKAVSAVKLPQGIEADRVQLRSSPNLRQWSRALDADINLNPDGTWLRLHTPQHGDWLSIRLNQETALDPVQLAVEIRDDDPLRARQWHTVQPDDKGVVTAPLREPIRGVRIRGDDNDIERFVIASRIKNSDAWKARGQWDTSQGKAQILFNGIGDQQWQLRAFPRQGAIEWQLAHDARELRVSGHPPLPLTAHTGSKRSANSACDAASWSGLAKQASLHLDLISTDHHYADDRSQVNVLPWFLGLVGLVLSGLFLGRKLRQ